MDWGNFIVGLCLGGGLCWIFFSFRMRHHSSQQALFEQEKQRLGTEAAQQEERLCKLEQTREQLTLELERERAQHLALKNQIPEQQKFLSTFVDNRMKQFVEESNARMRQQLGTESLTRMTETVRPLKEALESVRQIGADNRNQYSKEHGELQAAIKQLAEQSHSLGEQAETLTTALRGSHKAQGDFGEFILARLLDAVGLQAGTHYETQPTIRDEENQVHRPDVRVKLPNHREVFIDSKVSLESYANYTNATDDAQRQHFLAEYLGSVRRHMKGLQSKAYEQIAKTQEGQTLEYVLMFTPIESAFLLAIKEDPQLLEVGLHPKGGRGKVVFVGPTHLLCLLYLLRDLWTSEDRKRNAEKIARLGGKLYDKVSAFLEDMDKIGKHVKQLTESYDSAYKRLTSERADAITGLGKELKSLGADTTKEFPNAYQPTDPLVALGEQKTLPIAAEDPPATTDAEEETYPS